MGVMNKIDMQNVSCRILQNNYLKKDSHVRQLDIKQSFENILQKEVIKQNIKFSKHAVERMQIRDISLSNLEISKIEDAITKASAKGVKEALILMDDKAFIANIKNKTIITTVGKEQLKNNIFTNIDGAIII